MKSFFLLLSLIIVSTSQAKETFVLEFSNGTVELSANIEDSNDGFYVNDVSLEIPGQSHGSLHLVAKFGQGDTPYGYLCEQLSQLITQTDDYKYASAYGYSTGFGLFSGLLKTVEFFVVNPDKSFSLSDTYPNAVYDSGFACTKEEFIY